MIRIKTLLFGLFFLSSLTISSLVAQVDTTWTHTVAVTTGTEEFSKVEHFAYSTEVYDASASKIKSLVHDEVSARSSGKAKKRSVVEGESFTIPGHDLDSLNVLANIDDVKGSDDVVKVSFAFLHKNMAINPDDNPDVDKSARELVYNIGVALNKAVVSEEISDAEKELESLTKKRDAVVKQKETLEKKISDGEMKVVELTADSIKYESRMIQAQAEAESAETLAKSSTADSKALKKASKARKKAVSAEQDFHKIGNKKVATIADIKSNQAEVPVKEAEIAQYEEQMAAQELVVAALKRKYEVVE